MLVLELYEGEADVCSKNELLCSIRVPVPDAGAKRADFSIAADVDVNGTLSLTVADNMKTQISKVNVNSEVERFLPEASAKSNVISGKQEAF